MVATAIQPEVVDLPADTHAADAPLPATITHEEAATALIERAADAALMPGVPGRDEFLTLAATARILSLSGAAPEAVRNNPYIAFHVALVGRDLDLSPSASLNLIDVIEGKKGPQLSLSPQLLNGRIERLGLGHIVKVASTVESCYAVAVGPGGQVDLHCRRSWPDHAEGCECRGVIGDSEFTWEDARMAGLVGPSCSPGVHDPACLSWSKGKSCNQGYRTYPKRMLWWRAAGFCADDWFPTASMGLYSPEALGAVVDDEGRPIDPSTVKLPDGYEPAAPEPVAMAAGDVVEDLARRIHALPADAQDALKLRWKGDGDSPYLQPLAKLPERQVKKATALVDHFEQRARGGEWGDWDPPAAPPVGSSPDGDGSGPEAAPTAQDPAPSPRVDDPPAGDGAGDPPPPPVTEPPAPSSEPEARVGVPPPPAPPEAPSGAQSAESGAPGPCPVCSDTGILDGAPCWGCSDRLGPCTHCGSDEHLRVRVDVDTARCEDQDACWQREQAKDPAMAALATQQAAPDEPEPIDVPSREVVDAGDPDAQPAACPICGSARSVLVFVPNGHGQDGGVWRCSNGSACRERAKGKSGLDVARAALAEHEAKG